jgi:hypothetical protein
MHHDNDQSQSTLSPNSGQSTTGNPWACYVIPSKNEIKVIVNDYREMTSLSQNPLI